MIERRTPLRPRCATCSRPFGEHTPRMRHKYVPKRIERSGLRRITTAAGKPARLKSRLSDNADELAREIVYRRAGVQYMGARRVAGTGTCECCGQRETAVDPIEWAHAFPRARRRCRWEAWGALGVMRSHHRRYTRDSEGWRAVLVKRYGEETYLERYRLSQQTFGGSITVAFYRELIARLRSELAEMRKEEAA